MRRIPAFFSGSILALAALLPACGTGEPGFRIDNVSLSPNDVPIASGSTERLSVGADILDDTHVVTAAWMVAEDSKPLWFDLVEGQSGVRWSASIPLSSIDGLPIGVYKLDVHAEDDAGRHIELDDAVRLTIRFE